MATFQAPQLWVPGKLCCAFGEIWHSRYLTGEKFRINLGRSPGNSLAQEAVCVPLPQEPPVWSPRLFFFFGNFFLIVIECSTAYSKYHSYKFLASIFQSDHYLIFKTKQNKNPKESKTTKPDLHFIHTGEAMGLSNLYTPGCFENTYKFFDQTTWKTPVKDLLF